MNDITKGHAQESQENLERFFSENGAETMAAFFENPYDAASHTSSASQN